MSRKIGWIALAAMVAAAGMSAVARADQPRVMGWNLPEEPYLENGPATPRIQFVWQSPNQDRPTIWSSSLDGKDVRVAVSPELLFSGEAHDVFLKPVRSPSGRYIACSGHTKDGDQIRYLVDRKARKVKTIMEDAWGDAQFFWSPDSKHLRFYAGGDMWDYDVEKGERKKLPFIAASHVQFIDGGKRMLAVAKTGFEYYDANGKLLARKKWPYTVARIVAVSHTGSRVLVAGASDSFVVDPRAPTKMLFKRGESFGAAVFGGDEEVLYFDEPDEAGVSALWSLRYPMASRAGLGSFPRVPIGQLTFAQR